MCLQHHTPKIKQKHLGSKKKKRVCFCWKLQRLPYAEITHEGQGERLQLPQAPTPEPSTTI